MTQAFISGRFGRALYTTADEWWVHDLGLPPRRARQIEVSDLQSPTAEFRAVEFFSTELLAEQLTSEADFQNLLFLVLCSIDPDISLSTRLICASNADLCLKNSSSYSRVKGRLLSAPLTIPVRAIRSKTISYFSSFGHLASLLRSVYDAQPVIDEVVATWRQLTARLAGEDAEFLRSSLVDDGTFSEIVIAAQLRSLQSFNAAFVLTIEKTRSPEIRKQVRPILTSLRSSLQSTFFKIQPEQRTFPAAVLSSIGRRDRTPSSSNFSIGELLTRPYAEHSSRTSSLEAKTRVDKQVQSIREELFAGRLDLVQKYLRDLVKFQLDNSEREQLAKSLCSLASMSLAANQLDIANELSDYAVGLGIEDQVIYTSRAEVFKSMGLFEAALASFKEASLRFPNSSYAWNGIADVLKEQGLYEDSLASYVEAAKRFPESSVPRNGYVSTLRAQGRNRDALESAITVAREFPDDPVTISTLASALAANGKYDFALAQYKKVIESSAFEAKLISGYVRTLNALGMEESALRALQATLRQSTENLPLSSMLVSQLRVVGKIQESIDVARRLFESAPAYAPARFQLAASLIANRDFEGANQYLPKQDMRSEVDWFGFRLYTLSLIGSQRYAEAKLLLESAVSNCVWRRLRGRFITLLGFTQFKLKKAREAIKTLEIGIDELDDHRKQGRLVIMGAAQKARGKVDAGINLLTHVAHTKERSVLAYSSAALSARNFAIDIPLLTELNLLLAA